MVTIDDSSEKSKLVDASANEVADFEFEDRVVGMEVNQVGTKATKVDNRRIVSSNG